MNADKHKALEVNILSVRLNGSFQHPMDVYKERLKTEYLAVHCSATPASWDGSDSGRAISSIRQWHVHDRGWTDIGYHFIVTRDGLVWRGRPMNSIGAGVENWNSKSLHICLVGGVKEDWKTPENNFTEPQLVSLNGLLEDLRRVYPSAIIQGHRDFPGVTKACPSFDVRSWWAAKRAGHGSGT